VEVLSNTDKPRGDVCKYVGCGAVLRGAPGQKRTTPYCVLHTRMYNLWMADQRMKIRHCENVNRYMR
jgi:hypothetical protein